MRKILFILFPTLFLLQFCNVAKALSCSDFVGTWQGQTGLAATTIKMRDLGYEKHTTFAFEMRWSDGRGLNDGMSAVMECALNANGHPEINYTGTYANIHIAMNEPATIKINGNLFIYGNFSGVLNRGQ